MPSLLLVVFLVQVAIHLVNHIGAAAINDLIWQLYNYAPTSTSSDFKKLTHLRHEVVRLKRELNATSAQDQFAKWAKLQRQYEKILKEHDQKAADLKSLRASFDRTANIVRWLATNGLRFFLQWWYSRRAMFWLAPGLVPGWMAWLLAFPRAPTGSVSIQVWGTACATVIALVSEAGWAAVLLVLQQIASTRSRPAGKQPVKMTAGASVGGGNEQKKDL